MCRFVLYRGTEITLSSLVTEPVNSIIHQSFQSRQREEPLNGDGFGVAWYASEIKPEPVVFKDITPAWNNHNLQNIAPVIKSSCILAHVRAATLGLPVTRLNSHPFSWKQFSFMHNGSLAGFQSLRRKLLQRLSDEAFQLIEGSTDSEYLFALFVDHFQRKRNHPKISEAMATALADTIDEVEKLKQDMGIKEASRLNLAVTDGIHCVASRYISTTPEKAETLYVHWGSQYVCSGGVCEMISPDKGKGAVIIASEPLSEDEGWELVQPNHLVVVDETLGVDIRPIA